MSMSLHNLVDQLPISNQRETKEHAILRSTHRIRRKRCATSMKTWADTFLFVVASVTFEG